MSKILNLKEYVIVRTFSPWQSHEIASHSFAMTEQRGRSMVEMLGVLAIVGVLSVAGIAGYSNAMRQYRTNEIVNAISTLYVMGMAQNQGQGTGTLEYSSIGTNPSGVASLTYTNKTISATITDENDCKMVKNKLGDKAGECTATTGAYTLSISFGETGITLDSGLQAWLNENEIDVQDIDLTKFNQEKFTECLEDKAGAVDPYGCCWCEFMEWVKTGLCSDYCME